MSWTISIQSMTPHPNYCRSVLIVIISPGLKITAWPLLNTILFLRWRFVSFFRPTPKPKEHPLWAIRDFLFHIFVATFHIADRSSFCNLRTRLVVETRNHLSRSNFNKYKIYKMHGLTLVGLGAAVLVNEVTIVVNCYSVAYTVKQVNIGYIEIQRKTEYLFLTLLCCTRFLVMNQFNESIFCSKYMSLYIACGNVMVNVDKSTICKDRRKKRQAVYFQPWHIGRYV
jgi:hypothetical protein